MVDRAGRVLAWPKIHSRQVTTSCRPVAIYPFFPFELGYFLLGALAYRYSQISNPLTKP